jgi:hypothetical protein
VVVGLLVVIGCCGLAGIVVVRWLEVLCGCEMVGCYVWL